MRNTDKIKRPRDPQLTLLRKQPLAYGGELLKTRKARAHGRPLDTRNTMHLVLRSTKAIGDWSFKKPAHAQKIREISHRFAHKYGIRILSLANVGNHLHYQIKLSNRFTYRSFIRALTSAIAMTVTGVNRWNKWDDAMRLNHGSQLNQSNRVNSSNQREETKVDSDKSSDKKTNKKPSKKSNLKFWDYRPFTRVIKSFAALLNLRDYMQINELEGFGVNRIEARFIVESKSFPGLSNSS